MVGAEDILLRKILFMNYVINLMIFLKNGNNFSLMNLKFGNLGTFGKTM